MSDTELILVITTVLVGVILAPMNYIWAQLTLSYGLQQSRLHNAYWIGLALGPFGPLVMRLLPPGDPVQFRRDLARAYSEPPATGMAWSAGIGLTILGGGIGYYILASLVVFQGFGYITLWVIGCWLCIIGIGWLCHIGSFPPGKDLPAPLAIPSDTPGEGPRVVFDPEVNRLSQASLLVRYGATMLCILLVPAVWAITVTLISTGEGSVRPYFPLTLSIGILLVILICVGFTMSRTLKERILKRGIRERLTPCSVCGQRIIPGKEWLLEPGTCNARHLRCQELDAMDTELMSAAEIRALGPDDQLAVTEPGRACRSCGQYIDPELDAYLDCPDCLMTYHRSCFGQDVRCTYCAKDEVVPAVAERIARENEASRRVPRGAYGPQDGRQPVMAVDPNMTVCRSCGLSLKEEDGKVTCTGCRRIYHTACTAGEGLCWYCATEEQVPWDVESYCQEKEQRRYLQSTGNIDCPVCDAEIRDYGPGYQFCPFCGADLDVPDAYQFETVITKEDMDADSEGYAPGLPGQAPTIEERHGWLPQETHCCVLSPVALIGVGLAFKLGENLPLPWSDLSQGFALAMFATSVVVGISQWLINQVRIRIWPMAAPSAKKLQLIDIRTKLLWLAGIAGVVFLTLLAPDGPGFASAAEFFKWTMVVTGVGALSLALMSLFVK